MNIILETSSSNQEFISGLEELLESSEKVTTQIIVHSEDEGGIAADTIADTAGRLGIEITWNKNVVLEDIPDFVEPNPFGRGDEGEPTLYYLLNDEQKELYGRIAMEIDEFDLPLDQLKEVYAALIQDPDFTLKAVARSNDGCDWDV